VKVSVKLVVKLSTTPLVHLSHLKTLNLDSKCFWIQRVVVVVLLSAAEFAFVALSRACFMRFCLILILVFGFLFDWGRHRRSWQYFMSCCFALCVPLCVCELLCSGSASSASSSPPFSRACRERL
jgi:hypothetical protein